MKNKMNSKILNLSISVLVATSTATSFAQSNINNSSVSSSSSQKATMSEIKDLLWKDVQNRVITLTRDVRVYHYFQWKAPAGPRREVDLKAKLFQTYFRGELGQFWKESPQSSGVAGPGLYSAIDPAVSSGYGETMLEITLKKGTRIIDLGDSLGLSSELSQKIATLSSDGSTSYGGQTSLSAGTLSYGAINSSNVVSAEDRKKFKKSQMYIINEALKQIVLEQKITAIGYSWSTYIGTQLCSANSRLGTSNSNSYYSSGSYGYVNGVYTYIPNTATTASGKPQYRKARDLAFILIGKASSVKGARSGRVEIPSTMDVNVVTDTPGTLTGQKKIVYERVQKTKQIAMNSGSYYYSTNDASQVSDSEKTELKKAIFGCDENFKEDMND
jgi:hypothetical protein